MYLSDASRVCELLPGDSGAEAFSAAAGLLSQHLELWAANRTRKRGPDTMSGCRAQGNGKIQPHNRVHWPMNFQDQAKPLLAASVVLTTKHEFLRPTIHAGQVLPAAVYKAQENSCSVGLVN